MDTPKSTIMNLQEPDSLGTKSTRAYVDAHVHIHECFGIHEFLDAAARNFVFHSSGAALTTSCKYVLCLTETYEANKFDELAKQVGNSLANKIATDATWSVRTGDDEMCLIASHPIHGEIEIVAGRQIVTVERLEILALGTIGKWEDGLAASDIIESVIDSGAIPVLPWGFGKWLGRRSHSVARLIETFGDGSLYLGDNSGRPGILPDPAEFAVASDSDMRILPGSDPLPFGSEYDRAGSFGFYVDELADHESIWPQLRPLLQQGEGNLRNYGSLESSFRFARNQVAMQYVTRVTNRRKAS